MVTRNSQGHYAYSNTWFFGFKRPWYACSPSEGEDPVRCVREVCGYEDVKSAADDFRANLYRSDKPLNAVAWQPYRGATKVSMRCERVIPRRVDLSGYTQYVDFDDYGNPREYLARY